MSNIIPTAEEFIIIYNSSNQKDSLMVAFAKLHVRAALEAAYENVEINDYDEHKQYSSHVDKDSILNAYPLTNIK